MQRGESASPTLASANGISPELRTVTALHATIIQLRTRDAILTERIERDLREQEEVRGALAKAEAELGTAVRAQVDPTAWLPDEILWMILLRVLVGGACGRVCRRWHAVCAGATAKKQAWQWWWAGYTHGKVTPRTLQGGTTCRSLAVGLNGKLYGGDHYNKRICSVWSTVTNTHLQSLEGHTNWVNAVVGGRDGTVYSASSDKTVRIWSGEDGTHLHTLDGHTASVTCLAVGWDGTLCSGSMDRTILVWTDWRSGTGLTHRLEGHAEHVTSLALSNDGKLYSASWDTTIRAWSTVDSTHSGTLTGHTGGVTVVVVAVDGTVYSGSMDGTLWMWSGVDGSPIRTLEILSPVLASTIGAGNTVLIGDFKGRVSAWNGGAAPAHTLSTFTPSVRAVAIGQDGRLFVACRNGHIVYEL
jgi:hypothetical protein